MTSFSYEFNTPVYKGKSSFPTGLFIGGKFVPGSSGKTIEYVILFLAFSFFDLFPYSVINPTNGKLITSVSEGTEKDVDLAVEAAQKAFDTTWGLKSSGTQRSELLYKLATLMEKYHDELAALEALDNGMFPFDCPSLSLLIPFP